MKIDLAALPDRKEPLVALMCTPDHFNIVDVKNVHMEGNTGKVDSLKFKEQWQSIYDIYFAEARTGNIDGINKIPGVENCEDMVFCANQSFPWIDARGNSIVILSRMRYPSRQNEVKYFEDYYTGLNYSIFPPPGVGLLEGMGDLIPLPKKQLIFGGYGHRTDVSTLNKLADILHVQVVHLKLINEAFYHLDTCFIPLDTETVLIAPEAFDEEGLKSIRSCFKDVREIPFNESSKGFALNAHVVHGNQYPFAIIQKENPITAMILKEKGFKIYEVDTSEFMKSGGSVFCMKMMHY